MGALAGLMGGGGMSVSDQTSVTFNPFADNRKEGSITQYIKSGGPGISMQQILPIAIVAAVVLLAWKLLK